MRLDDRWPGHPRLLPDESISSWFTRTAAANGLPPGELYRIVQPGGDSHPRDLDRHADDCLLDLLAGKTGLAVEDLKHATFRRWSGWLFEHDDGLNKLAWLPPAGREGGRRCFGQQICPWCLRADAQPYLRLNWRLSFFTTCPIHGRLLLDRCPSCAEPFSILRQNGRGAICCPGCGADLRDFSGDEPALDTVPVQRDLLELIREGWRDLGEYGPVYSFAVFEMLAQLLRLLAGGKHAHALRLWLAEHDPSLAVRPESLPRARDGALLTPRARGVLVAMVHWLLTDWPRRFVEAAKAVGMTSTDLRKRLVGEYPFAYAHAVDWHLKEPHKGDAADEIAVAAQVLHDHGQAASRRNLVALCGTKLGSMGAVAEPVVSGLPWGKGRYWKLDGVSPEVKAAARRAAHRAGEDVGPWLDALLRRTLGLGAIKTPFDGHDPDTITPDGNVGCKE